MNFRIAVDFARRRLKNLRAAFARQFEKIDRAKDRRLNCLERIVLIVARRGGTRKIVYFVDFKRKRNRYVVPNQLKVRPRKKRFHIRLLTRKEIIDTDYFVSSGNQFINQVASDKTGAAGNK